MNFEKKSRKEARAQLRAWIIQGAVCGGYDQRCRLLAYGFLRGLPYEAIEQKTNEDKHCDIGRETFYSGLAMNIASLICEATETEFSYNGQGRNEAYEWLFVRLSKLAREAA